MKLVVLSGKGGVGKTLVSVNLTNVLSEFGKIVHLDCDVEEPNSNIFLKRKIDFTENVDIQIPYADSSKCTKCGLCSENCQFGAISVFKTGTVVFESLCHGCGVCSYICPEKAIKEKSKTIGNISFGEKDNIIFGEGVLKIGEPSGVKVIRKLKNKYPDSDIIITDAPPGASCSVVETLKGADYALVITESTPFGLHDMKAVLEIALKMNIKTGVVINRYDENYKETENYLRAENIEIISKIPFIKEIAEIYSVGGLISSKKEYRKIFLEIAEKTGVLKCLNK